MIPRNYLEFVFFFKNTFYASGCLNYDELTHNNDSYSLGQGVLGMGKELFKHQYTSYMSMVVMAGLEPVCYVCFKYLVSHPPPGNPGGKFIDVDAVPRSELTYLCSSKGGEKKLLHSRGRDWTYR